MPKPKLLIFSSGSKDGGGSGFANLVKASRTGILDAEIVGVVSSREHGGVRAHADKLGIPFVYFAGPYTHEEYQRIARESGAEFFALSGWLKMVSGLDPATPFNSRTVFNIHPGPLPRFGGPGMYGHHVHEAVAKAIEEGEDPHSAVSMHFVVEPKSKEDYDKGPVILSYPVELEKGDTAEVIYKKVNTAEHKVQPVITNLVVQGKIRWDGVDPKSLVRPEIYNFD